MKNNKMITNIYIKQLFHILKKYGQVNLFKTRVPMDGLQSIIEKYHPHDYFYRITIEFFKKNSIFRFEISREYDNFINDVYKKKIVEYLKKENIYDLIKHEYECDRNSWKKLDTFEEYLDKTQWFEVLSDAFPWKNTSKNYEYWANLSDEIMFFLESQKEGW